MNARVHVVAALFGAACQAGCITQAELQPDIGPNFEAVQDFIAVRRPPPATLLRPRPNDTWQPLSYQHIVYASAENYYLLGFSRPCVGLFRSHVTTGGVRNEFGVLRTNFDQFHGCRIDSMYSVSRPEVQELINIGQSVGAQLSLRPGNRL